MLPYHLEGSGCHSHIVVKKPLEGKYVLVASQRNLADGDGEKTHPCAMMHWRDPVGAASPPYVYTSIPMLCAREWTCHLSRIASEHLGNLVLP